MPRLLPKPELRSNEMRHDQLSVGTSTTVNEPACIVRDVLLWHCVVRSHGWNLESRRSVTNSVAEAAKKELEIDGKLCVMLPLILVIPQTGKFAPM